MSMQPQHAVELCCTWCGIAYRPTPDEMRQEELPLGKFALCEMGNGPCTVWLCDSHMDLIGKPNILFGPVKNTMTDEEKIISALDHVQRMIDQMGFWLVHESGYSMTINAGAYFDLAKKKDT